MTAVPENTEGRPGILPGRPFARQTSAVDLLLKVGVKRLKELLRRQPRSLLADEQSQVLGHLAGLDGPHANLFERLRETDQLGVVVQLAAVFETPRPGEDRRDRVRRRRLAQLVLPVVPGHRAVRGLSLDG